MKGPHSKCLEAPAVSSAENVRRTGLCAGSDFTISYRSCVFFLHSSGARITLEIYGELSERSKVRHSKSQNFGRADDINCIRRGIEVVITGLTRNQFGSNPTRVRIPPSPPEKNRVNPVFTRFFHIYGQNGRCDKHRPFCYFRANVITIFFDNTTLARPPPRSKKA